MKTKFTQNIVLLLLLNFLIKPFWVFGIDRSIQNTVGADQYGLYFSLFSFSLLFNIVADLGITNYNSRYIAQNQHTTALRISNILPAKLVLSFIYAIITLISALIIGYSPYQILLLVWLIFNQVIISISQYLRSNVSGLQLFNTNSVLSIIDKLILIIICSYLLWFYPYSYFKIEWLIYSQTIAYFIAMLLSFIVLIKHVGAVSLNFKAKNSLTILRKSIPYAILIFLMTIYTRIDAIMIERMLPEGKQQAGIYAQAFRIIDALYMITVLFGSILLPLFAKLIKEKAEIKSLVNHSFAILIVPCLALLIAVFFYSQNIMQLLYIKHINESSVVLLLLTAGFVGIALGYIFGTLLTADGRLKLLNKIALATVAINIFTNYLLIPKYGIVGAAFSSMLTQITAGIVQVLGAIIIFKFEIKLIIIFKYILLITILAIVSYLIYLFIKPWFIAFILIGLMSIPIALVMGIIKFQDIKEIAV